MADGYEVQIDMEGDDPTREPFTEDEIRENESRVEITSESPTGAEASVDDIEPEVTYDGPVEPFESEQAMQEAWTAKNEYGEAKTEVDPEYAAKVQARTALSMYVDGFSVARFDPEKAQQLREKTEAQREAEEAERKQRELTVGDYSQLQVRGEQEAREREEANQPQGFQSEAELEDAVMDPKYRTHPSYRQKVDRRIEATDWL